MIQTIKIYLRTLFGMSNVCYIGEDRQLFQDIVQGNGAAPLLWLIITIFSIQYLYSKKVVTHLFILISNLIVLLAALLCTNDTDLYIFNSRYNSTREVVHKAQNLPNA